MIVVKPIFRIFSYEKALEFYVDWLGFNIDWEHKPENAPMFIQVSLREIVLNLSEHHGDATPGSHLRIDNFESLRDYQKLILEKNYKFNRPGLEIPEWNTSSIEMTVIDPFGNRMTFSENLEAENALKQKSPD